MGRMSIIAVITLVFTLSIIGYNLNRRATDAVENYVGNYDQTCAEDVASSAAEIYIYKLKESPSLTGSFTIDPILGGSATVTIAQVATDTLKMTSVGTYNTFSDTIKNKLYAVPINIPPIMGGVSMSASKSASLTVSGTATISGVDENPDGTPVLPPDSVAGIALNSTASSGSISLNNNINGKGTVTPDTEVVTNVPDYTSFADEMIRLATVYTGQTFSSGTLGTDANPQITYFTGTTKITGPVTGSGILIVNGNLDMSGQFTFHGLVIVYGSGSITVTQTGTSSIYGGVVLAGSSTSYTQKGTSLVQYSSTTLKNVRTKTVGKYLIADWWE